MKIFNIHLKKPLAAIPATPGRPRNTAVVRLYMFTGTASPVYCEVRLSRASAANPGADI